MKYIFYCHDCGENFKKTTKIKKITTDYGIRNGIKCPLCNGRAVAVGQPSILGGFSDNGIADSKYLDLDAPRLNE